MNKRLLTTITVIVAFLAVAFIVTSQPTSKKNATSYVPTVGILQLVTHPALDQIHKGVVDGLKSEGYSGKKIKIDYQNAQADQSNLKTMSQKFANENADLTIGIATPAALSLAKTADGNTPVILAGITDPAGSGLVKTTKRPGRNITGVSGDSPLQQHLNVIKQVVPKAKTLGIIYTTSDHGGEYNAKNMEKIAKNAGYNVKMYTISTTNDMQQIAETMASQVDVVYAPQDNGVASAMKTLINVTNQDKIPVIPAVDTMVKDGGIATMSVSQYNIGYQAGIMAGKVLKGKSTATYSVKTITEGDMTINLKQAKLLGLTLPKSMVHEAETKGEVFK
ncbi:ABC transporter substrate-binding protein [Leuconostoc litchii]|uniref:ABC transporter substrate-binding protein n=1 Tax=Leuconostoc litchii TaxID=1981069 RepID=A0A6P2CLC8_9LACO|nr:tryptophan ABC transporter substrate-binding protein [Leuconostoc litchii]TYC46247.1 ABC transporter substrate-binding protein [Leuconostoc litchii]GMA69954.1 ABC transporter substrate-binding protein [Leuconostoc litchii]